MARSKTQTQMSLDPSKWEVDGLIPTMGEMLQWDGNQNGNNQGCSTCDVAQVVEVVSVDENDPHGQFRLRSDSRDNCCGEFYACVQDLKRDNGSLPVLAALAKDLRDKVNSGTITQSDLAKRVDEIFTTMARDHYSSGKKPFKGVCSACYTDVILVGGSVEHADKRICSTPAILLP